MKTAVLCIGGQGPEPEVLESLKADTHSIIAAADSGYHLAEHLGLQPSILVGDMDSISHDPAELDIEVISHPPDKDYSDTQLACMLLKDRGIEQLIILGGGEGRLDHILGLCSYFEDVSKSMDIHWITRMEHIWFLHNRTLHLTGVPGTRVSIFPLEKAVFSSRGLHWDTQGASYSLSNRLEGKTCKVTAHKGSVMVITPLVTSISYRLGQ